MSSPQLCPANKADGLDILLFGPVAIRIFQAGHYLLYADRSEKYSVVSYKADCYEMSSISIDCRPGG